MVLYIGRTQISSVNSSTTNLAAGNSYTFTGTAEQTTHPDVMINLYADQATTIQMQFSQNGTNWDSTITKLGTSGFNEFTTAVKGARYFRVVVTTASLTTTIFRLQTQYGTFRQGNLPLNANVSLDSDAIVTRSTVPQDEIRIGRRTGVTGWNKFAYREGLTAAGGEQTIWATTGNYTPASTAYTFDIAYDGTAGGSTDGSGTTGARELTFYYVDSNGLPAIGVHTLGTDGTDTTSFSGYGINRIAVSDSGTNKTNVSNITITHSTGGATMAIIPAGGGVTQQAIFHVGSNHVAIAKYLRANISAATKTAIVLIKGYVYNRAIDCRFEVFREKIDTSVSLTLEINEPIGFVLNSTDVLYFIADSDSNSVDVNDFRFSLNEYQKT